MKRKYRRLMYEDRKKIEDMGKSGCTVIKISTELGVHHDTIYKELKRCGVRLEEYDAEAAQRSL